MAGEVAQVGEPVMSWTDVDVIDAVPWSIDCPGGHVDVRLSLESDRVAPLRIDVLAGGQLVAEVRFDPRTRRLAASRIGRVLVAGREPTGATTLPPATAAWLGSPADPRRLHPRGRRRRPRDGHRPAPDGPRERADAIVQHVRWVMPDRARRARCDPADRRSAGRDPVGSRGPAGLDDEQPVDRGTGQGPQDLRGTPLAQADPQSARGRPTVHERCLVALGPDPALA